MTIAFFHQNEVIGAQGGIQRFLATLMDQGKEACFLVTESIPDQGNNRLCLPLIKIPKIPKWIRFTLTVWLNVFKIRAYLKEIKATTLEFSRAEYSLFAFFFPGKKVFTYHGTGPQKTELMQKAATSFFSWLVMFQADQVQIVGPDARALPKFVQKKLKDKIVYVDAWYDDCFRPAPLPETDGPIKIFYAGRIHPQKNPELLFKVAQAVRTKYGDDAEFHYYGADGNLIPPETGVIDHGLQSPEDLANGMRSCHFGILTSFYEGSPFIVIETLACGRGYVIAPILGVMRTYPEQPGVVFPEDYEVESFMKKIEDLSQQMKNGELTADIIADKISHKSKRAVTHALIDRLSSLGKTSKQEKQTA